MALAWRLEGGHSGCETTSRVVWVGTTDRLDSQRNSRSCILSRTSYPVSEMFVAILFMEFHNTNKVAILSKRLRKAQERGARRQTTRDIKS